MLMSLVIRSWLVRSSSAQSDEEGNQEKAGEDGQQKFIAHVPVPSQQEVGWMPWEIGWMLWGVG